MVENILLGIVVISLVGIGLNLYVNHRYQKNIKELIEEVFKIKD